MNTKVKIAAFACITRIFVIIVQFIANIAIADHNAGVFQYPKSNGTQSRADSIISLLFSGFIRWDAEYFMHIAKYGYTYENTLAFFPLYPLLAKGIAHILSYILVFLNEDSVLIITFLSLNIYFFVYAAITLYELSACLLNAQLSYVSAILFCINPATIFFVAPYSESLFSYLTFKYMLNCMLIYGKYSSPSSKRLKFKIDIHCVVPLALSTCVRSNGILNIGFIAYFMIQSFTNKYLLLKSAKNRGTLTIQYSLILILIVSIALIPFVIVQLFDYYQFCTNFDHRLPDFLVSFAENNDYVLRGMFSKYNQSWCFNKLPLAYSYVQNHYWNVGFLKYFQLKQLPNFLLAFPIIFIIGINSLKFFRAHKEYCVTLGIFRYKSGISSTKPNSFEQEMFVFIVHALFLCIFCFLYIHVQVTTRMVCSASPVLYWFAAYYVTNENSSLLINSRSREGTYIIYYFLSYTIIGTVLFANFLPWT